MNHRRTAFGILVATTALSLLGVLLLFHISLRLTPSRNKPAISVSYSLPDASPRTVERDITSKLEGVLSHVKGVENVSSVSKENTGTITLSFDNTADIPTSKFHITTLLRQIWPDMPTGISYPHIQMVGLNDEDNNIPFVSLAFYAPIPDHEIVEYATENITPKLITVEGVEDVAVQSNSNQTIELIFDNEIMERFGVAKDDIIESIRLQGMSVELGRIENDSTSFNAKILTDGLKNEDLKNIVVANNDNGILRLKDICKITVKDLSKSVIFRMNGQNAVYCNIALSPGYNQLMVSRKIEEQLKSIRKSLPDDFKIEVTYNASEYLWHELETLIYRSCITLGILLLFVWITTLSIRYVLIISIALSANLLLAVCVFYLLGIEINIYSLAGITVSFNLIIDNSIVMIEHIRHKGTIKAIIPILAATLTTIGALSILFVLDETTRLSLIDFALVVAINLGISVAVALWLIPSLLNYIQLQKKNRKYLQGISAVNSYVWRLYKAYIKTSIRFRYLIIACMAILFVGSWWLFDKFVYAGEYFNREVKEPIVTMAAILPDGSTIEQSDRIAHNVEDFIAGFDGIRNYQTTVFPGRLIARIFFTKEAIANGVPEQIQSEAIIVSSLLGAATWSITGIEALNYTNSVMVSPGEFKIKLSGYNYDELVSIAYKLSDSLTTHPRINNISINSEISRRKNDYFEYELVPDYQKISHAGISIDLFVKAISQLLSRQEYAGTISVSDKIVKVVQTSKQSGQYDLWQLLNMPLWVQDQTVKLSDYVSLEKRKQAQSIVRENREYVIWLQFPYRGSYDNGRKFVEPLVERMNRIVPQGYKLEFVDDEKESQELDYPTTVLALIIVFGVIFVITSVLFNSLKIPFAVILTIPFSFIGVFLTFFFSAMKFDQGGLASFILLSGLTVNAAIYILYDYNTRLHDNNAGDTAFDLYIMSFKYKIKAILLTVVSTIVGFLPMILSISKESFWFALALGTIGGLLMSLFVLVFILPCLVLKKDNHALPS